MFLHQSSLSVVGGWLVENWTPTRADGRAPCSKANGEHKATLSCEDRREDSPAQRAAPFSPTPNGLSQSRDSWVTGWADFLQEMLSSRFSCLWCPVLRLCMLTDATWQLLSGNLVMLLNILIPWFVCFPAPWVNIPKDILVLSKSILPLVQWARGASRAPQFDTLSSSEFRKTLAEPTGKPPAPVLTCSSHRLHREWYVCKITPIVGSLI